MGYGADGEGQWWDGVGHTSKHLISRVRLIVDFEIETSGYSMISRNVSTFQTWNVSQFAISFHNPKNYSSPSKYFLLTSFLHLIQ